MWRTMEPRPRDVVENGELVIDTDCVDPDVSVNVADTDEGVGGIQDIDEVVVVPSDGAAADIVPVGLELARLGHQEGRLEDQTAFPRLTIGPVHSNIGGHRSSMASRTGTTTATGGGSAVTMIPLVDTMTLAGLNDCTVVHGVRDQPTAGFCRTQADCKQILLQGGWEQVGIAQGLELVVGLKHGAGVKVTGSVLGLPGDVGLAVPGPVVQCGSGFVGVVGEEVVKVSEAEEARTVVGTLEWEQGGAVEKLIAETAAVMVCVT